MPTAFDFAGKSYVYFGVRHFFRFNLELYGIEHLRKGAKRKEHGGKHRENRRVPCAEKPAACGVVHVAALFI